MIIGDKSIFAIESYITQAYERLGFRALGYFVIYVGGVCYGVRQSNATLLACAFDEVRRMILNRGNQTIPFSNEPNAGDIVDAICQAIYAPDPKATQFFGISIRKFINIVHSSHCEWHRVCDEAFDDGSIVLCFDVDNRVRLIADRPTNEAQAFEHDPETLRDIWLEAKDFYCILENWHKTFEAEWKSADKVPESEDGAEPFNQTTNQ
jgi:hypothetical protein